MPESSDASKTLRERLGSNTEDRLGKALSDLLESPLLTGAVGRAFDAREKASQAQEVALGALNIPTAADIERLTRRLRAVSHRLEGIEDGLDRLDRALAPSGVDARLSAIEGQLRLIDEHVAQLLAAGPPAAAPPAEPPASSGRERAVSRARAAARAKSRGASPANSARKPGRAAGAGSKPAAGARSKPGAAGAASKPAPGAKARPAPSSGRPARRPAGG